jgi:uncharacterized cupredoxin-like copper-binding protein
VKRPIALLTAAGLCATAAAVPLATASNPTAHSAATSVSVTGKEFKFTLSRGSVRHGRVTFHFKNVGKIQHDFKIGGRRTKLVSPKKSATLSVSLKKGRFTYICTVPGHAQSGMKGTLKVT